MNVSFAVSVELAADRSVVSFSINEVTNCSVTPPVHFGKPRLDNRHEVVQDDRRSVIKVTV